MGKQFKKAGYIFFFIILTLFLPLCILSCSKSQGAKNTGVSEKPLPQLALPKFTLTISDKATLAVEAARTPGEKAMGLSWRKSLGQEEGMLFIHEEPQVPEYWMYGMQFPLDFIWVRGGEIVDVSENIPPPAGKDDPPSRIRPSGDVDSVLEVNAGFIKKHGIKVGDKVNIKL